MPNLQDVTFGVPRFLAFIDLAYLREAAKIADDHLAKRIASALEAEDRNEIGNLNATRQSLLRAVFIASYAIFEQNLDELMEMRRKKRGIKLAASDLKDRGVTRSVTYANKVLGLSIDVTRDHWRELFLLQEVRNHLAHYGPDFAASSDHDTRFAKFQKSRYVTLRPALCFSMAQIDLIAELYMVCIRDFNSDDSKRAAALPTSESP